MFSLVGWFFVVGFLVAIALEAIWGLTGYYSPRSYWVERLACFLWPTSLFKMLLDESRDSWAQLLIIYIVSFVGNGIVYGFVGFLLALAKRILLPPQ